MSTPLLDRIERRKADDDALRSFGFPTLTEIERRPVWLQRMDERGLPEQDRTSTIYSDGENR